jgi:hypothetical protein
MNSAPSTGEADARRRVVWWVVLAAIHVAACVTMWVLPKTGLVPSLTTAKGFWAFAVDASDFNREATLLAGVLREHGWAAWWDAMAQSHSRVVSLFYAVFGASILGALPFLTGTYLLIVFTVSRLGTLLFDRRAGVVAATMVAAWPSFFVHSTQLVRDPLFILGQLALVTGMVLLLLRGDAGWRRCLEIAAWSIAGFYAAYSVRTYTGELNVLVWMLALVLLVIGAVQQRHVPWRKAVVGLLVLLVLGQVVFARLRVKDPGLRPVAPFASVAVVLRQDENSLRSIEQLANPDAAAAAGAMRAARAANRGGPYTREEQQRRDAAAASGERGDVASQAPSSPMTIAQKLEYWLLLVVDKRNDFSRFDIVGGSNIDRDVTFAHGGDVIRYMPRAIQIGLAAPFPVDWFGAGEGGRVVRMVAGVETAVMYVLIPFALLAVWRCHRHLAVWLSILFAVGGMTLLGLIVPNVGTIFRLRYSFWFLIVVIAAPEVRRLVTQLRGRGEPGPRIWRAALLG